MNQISQLDRFIRAVHRRMVLLRAAERIGLCILGACVVLVILMPILIWRSQETGQLALVTFIIAAAAGIAWAIASRPTQLSAASEADRQLKLSDLLGTALLLRRSGAQGSMEQTVLALAEAHSAAASPSAVVLHRLGARGWGGIGLAAALVGGLCLMGPENTRSQARADGPKSWQDIEREKDQANATRIGSKLDMRRTQEGTGADDDDPLKSQVTGPDQTTASANANSNTGSQNNDGGNQPGIGAGTGKSASRTNPKTSPDPASSANSTTNKQGDAAGGGGATAENGNTTGTTGSTAGAAKTRRPAPIWQSDTWRTDQEAARTAIRSGQVPDAYRDLVREYFEGE